MKNVLAALVLLSGSMAMAAGSIYVDGRFDHVSYAPNDAVGKPGYEAFQINRLKLDYQGKLSDQNSFRARLDAIQNTAGKQTRDNGSPFLDLAYVTHKFNEEISLTVGKFVTGMGGIEGSVNSPGDMYARSIAGNEVAAVYYPTGAQAEYAFGDHKFKLNFANNTQDSVTGTNLNQTRALAGAVYLGKMLDSTLWLNASYHTEDYTPGTGTQKVKNSFTAVGAKYVMDSFEFEADYLNNKYDLDVQANNNVLGTVSALGLVRYKLNDLGSFHVKYENSEQKVAVGTTADTKNKIAAYTAAFEYKPVKDENWRMHLAFVQRDTKPETGDTRTEKFVYAGMRFYADILK